MVLCQHIYMSILLTIIHATLSQADVTAIAVPDNASKLYAIYLSYTSTSITISILTIIIQLISLLMSELYFSILVRRTVLQYQTNQNINSNRHTYMICRTGCYRVYIKSTILKTCKHNNKKKYIHRIAVVNQKTVHT